MREADTMTDTKTVSRRIEFSDETLAGIRSFSDAIGVLKDSGIVPESASDYGTGFHVADKATLVGVPFVALAWRFNTGAYERAPGEVGDFVSVECVTERGDKVVINDGSTGICRQLRAITDQREMRGHATPQHGLLCERGLAKSEYEYVDDKGRKSPAATYYLAD